MMSIFKILMAKKEKPNVSIFLCFNISYIILHRHVFSSIMKNLITFKGCIQSFLSLAPRDRYERALVTRLENRKKWALFL